MVSALKTRLAPVLAVSMITLGALVGYNLINEYRRTVAAARSELGELTAAVADSQHAILSSMHDVLLGLLNRRSVDDRDGPQCSSELARFRPGAIGLINAGIVDAGGVLLCSGLPVDRTSLDPTDRSWFRDALASPSLAVGEYQVGRTDPGRSAKDMSETPRQPPPPGATGGSTRSISASDAWNGTRSARAPGPHDISI